MAVKDKLTASAVLKARPGAKPCRHFDGGGLYLEVMPNGSKYWRMKYRHAGREKRLAFGVYPAVSLAKAREEREKARAILAEDRDPLAAAKAEKLRKTLSAGNTFKAVADDWLAVRKHGWTPLQHVKEKGRLENHAYPWIGALPVAELGVLEVRPLLDRLVKAGHIEQAHRLREQLSRVFRHAVANEQASRDPAHDLRDSLPARVYRRYATITEPAKVAELLRAIDGFGGTFPVRCALQLAPLLFVRPGELRAAEWSEIDLAHPSGPRWIIPPVRRKLKKAAKEHPDAQPHIVPLSSQAVAILRELEPLTGHGRYLFPGARNPKRPMSENTINAALRRLSYDKNAMTGHGFRHMASTLLNEMGHNKDAIERQLSHKEPGVAGVYNLSELLPDRQQMMQAWANYLDGLRGAVPIVVPIKRRA
jgi:integrase